MLPLFAALLIFNALPAQSWMGIRGEGPEVTRRIDVENFDGFTLAVNARLEVTQGSNRSVEVEGQENIIDNILTKVKNGHWKIKFDKNVRRHDGLTIRITMPRLNEASISGSGSIEGRTPFTGLGDLQIGISGSGDIDLDVEAANLQTSISGSGDIRLGGSANRHEVRISGSGDIDAGDLKAAACQVRISGSGDAVVNASEDLQVTTSGSGDVYYYGRPRVKAKVSGSGDIEPRGDG